MKLHHIFVLHKWLGLSLGSILLLLGLTGFCLNHANFNGLWKAGISDDWLPHSIVNYKNSSFTSFKVDAHNPAHVIAGSRMGLFVSWDGGNHFTPTLTQQTLAIEPSQTADHQDFQHIYAATNQGVYQSQDGGNTWQVLALAGKNVESLNHFNGQLFAVVDKREIWQIDTATKDVQTLTFNPISRETLPTEISLGRFVRDLHYGRGLFDSDLSLYLNDAVGLILTFLGISGWVIYVAIRRIRAKKNVHRLRFKTWVRSHSHGLMLWALLPILILLITGVLLDHSKAFQTLLNQTKLQTAYLPPVYQSLAHDIWGFDFDGQTYRLGNRLGVFKSTDLQNWELDSAGFAFKLKRVGSRLMVSGMGAPSRELTATGWQTLWQAPHMPKDVYQMNNELQFLAPHDDIHALPTTSFTPWYLILLSLHDGGWFAGQWVWVNDAAVIAALLLFMTGFIKWRRKRRI